MAKEKKVQPQEQTASVSIRASKAIKTRLKIHAASVDRDMREVADEALDEYLKKRGA